MATAVDMDDGRPSQQDGADQQADWFANADADEDPRAQLGRLLLLTADTGNDADDTQQRQAIIGQRVLVQVCGCPVACLFCPNAC